MLRWLAVLGVLAAVSEAQADRMSAVLDKPAFTATPAELAEIGKLVPAGDASVVILRQEEEVALDDRSRAVTRWRRVFLVRTQEAAQTWDTLETWYRGHQDKPAVRARVIAPDGTARAHDPALVTDVPNVQAAGVTSELRRVTATLPRLEVGAIVEEEIVTRDKEPFHESGSVHRNWLGESDAPTLSTRIIVSAPTGRGKVHVRALPAGVAPVRSVAGGRETWTVTLGKLAPNPNREIDMPFDVALRGRIGIATGVSWKAVATSYRALIDRRISDAPFALPASLPRTPAIESARAIVAWLHRTVRDNHLGFDEVSPAPSTPADTVKRGTGSRLDRAVVLVALLRQTGMRADLALISAGSNVDVDRELPALESFDHPLVRARIAGQDVWIDPAQELLAVGQLPTSARNRAVLVVADDTVDLVATPAWRATDNTVRELRTVELAEYGPAVRVTEVDRFTGAFDLDQRQWLHTTKPEKLRASMASYVKDEFGATFERLASSPAAEPDVPFERTAVAANADVLYVQRYAVDFELPTSSVLAWIPNALKYEGHADRKQDWIWRVPCSIELEHRIAVPEGFDMPVLPADEVAPLGTASLTTKSRRDGRTVVVTMRFDSGKLRLTPAEFAATRAAVAVALKQKVHIHAAHTGLALAQKGKLREAVVELERLIALHPKEALHHTQLALALLDAGMGEAARRAARKAVAVAPASADAHYILAYILRRDTLGRADRGDWDRAGALAAFAKARKLDPSLSFIAGEHADLLALGNNGLLWDHGCDLAASADARRATIALTKSDDDRLKLAETLIRMGNGASARALVEPMPATDLRDTYFVAGAALVSVADAITIARNLRGSVAAQNALLEKAGGHLNSTRAYVVGKELMTAAGKLASPSVNATILTRLQRHDPPLASDLVGLTVETLVLTVDPALPFSGFADPRLDKEFREMAQESVQQVRTALQSAEVDRVRDIMYTAFDASSADAAGLTRVELTTLPGAPPEKHVAYFARDGGAPKIVGTPHAHAAIGRYVMKLAARKADAAAMQLLDWFVDDAKVMNANVGAMLAVAWGPGNPRDRDQIALAGALIGSKDEPSALPILTTCGARAGNVRELCDQILSIALTVAGRAKELEAHAATWASRSPTPDIALLSRGVALASLGRAAEAEAIADGILAKRDFLPARRLRVDTAVVAGALPEAIQRIDQLVTPAAVEANNQAAWLRVVAETDYPKALELATRAAGNKATADPNVLNTLAAVEVELGALGDAKANEWAVLDKRAIRASDWYVIGRIAEQMGLRDDAIAYYRRVTRAVSLGEPEPVSAFALAKRRLARLGVK